VRKKMLGLPQHRDRSNTTSTHPSTMSTVASEDYSTLQSISSLLPTSTVSNEVAIGPVSSTEECRVLVVGDPHFKLTNIVDTEAMTKSILAMATLHKPDIIVILGDILDRFETMHISPFARATRFLMDCLEIADTYLLIGNHDLKNNRQFLSTEHPFMSCHLWNHPDKHQFTVVDNVVTRQIKGKKGNSVQMTFLPYVPPGMFETALNSNTPLLNWKESRVIFAHQEFYGAIYEAGSSTEGDKWPLEYPLVISGHIHDYQRLQENILYVGTPIQHGYDDRHNKTISLLTFTTTSWAEHRLTLDVKKKTIRHITVHEVGIYQVPDDEISKIVISGTASEIKGINRHPAIKMWIDRGHKVTYKTLPNPSMGLSNSLVAGGARPVLRFTDLLHSKLGKQPHLIPLYQKVFSLNSGNSSGHP